VLTLLREPAGFRTAEGMETFLGGYGIDGMSTRQRSSSYLFLGSVTGAAPGTSG
jgi:hypothetical protein